MKQQTAVEWFAQWVNYHKLNQSLTLETLDDLTVKAKQMEADRIQSLKDEIENLNAEMWEMNNQSS